MRGQSISNRLLKAVLMGLIMAALLLSFRVSASAAQKIYPSSTKTTVLTKGFKYKMYYSSEYYTFKSSKPSVASISKKGVITAKRKGTCHIHVYSKYNGRWVNGFPMKVKANKTKGRSYSSIRVKQLSYGTNIILSKGYVKGRKLYMNMVIANNRAFKISKIKKLTFTFYVDGKKIYQKSIRNKTFRVKKYGKKKLDLKFKLKKSVAKRMDLNYATIYCSGLCYITY